MNDSGGKTHFNSLYKSYKKNASKRNIKFDINEKDFRKINKMNCHYCGCEPSAVSITSRCFGQYVYSGLDRKDNSKGYSIDNVVPCCKRCNFAKYTFSQDEFKEQVAKIYNHFVIGGDK